MKPIYEVDVLYTKDYIVKGLKRGYDRKKNTIPSIITVIIIMLSEIVPKLYKIGKGEFTSIDLISTLIVIIATLITVTIYYFCFGYKIEAYKTIKRNKEIDTGYECNYKFFEDFYRVQSDEEVTEVSYKKIKSIKEDKKYFFLTCDNMVILKKDCFISGDLNKFKEFLLNQKNNPKTEIEELKEDIIEEDDERLVYKVCSYVDKKWGKIHFKTVLIEQFKLRWYAFIFIYQMFFPIVIYNFLGNIFIAFLIPLIFEFGTVIYAYKISFKKYTNDLKVIYKFKDDYFDIYDGQVSVKNDYGNIKKIKECKSYFLLLLNNNLIYIIYKDEFLQGDLSEFKNFIKSKK